MFGSSLRDNLALLVFDFFCDFSDGRLSRLDSTSSRFDNSVSRSVRRLAPLTCCCSDSVDSPCDLPGHLVDFVGCFFDKSEDLSSLFDGLLPQIVRLLGGPFDLASELPPLPLCEKLLRPVCLDNGSRMARLPHAGGGLLMTGLAGAGGGLLMTGLAGTGRGLASPHGLAGAGGGLASPHGLAGAGRGLASPHGLAGTGRGLASAGGGLLTSAGGGLLTRPCCGWHDSTSNRAVCSCLGIAKQKKKKFTLSALEMFFFWYWTKKYI